VSIRAATDDFADVMFAIRLPQEVIVNEVWKAKDVRIGPGVTTRAGAAIGTRSTVAGDLAVCVVATDYADLLA